jgi:hypothetical protein
LPYWTALLSALAVSVLSAHRDLRNRQLESYRLNQRKTYPKFGRSLMLRSNYLLEILRQSLSSTTAIR